MKYSPLPSLPGKKRCCFILSLNYQIHYLNIKVLKTYSIVSCLFLCFLSDPLILRHEAVSIAMTFRK